MVALGYSYLSFDLRGRGGEYGEIALLDAATWKVHRLFEPHPGGVQTLAFSPDGKRLASATGPVVKLYAPDTGKERGGAPRPHGRGHVRVVPPRRPDARLWQSGQIRGAPGDGQATSRGARA